MIAHDAALEALAAAGNPHVWRYRQLAADDNPDAAQRDAYRALVIALAGGARPPPPASAPDPDYLARLPPLGGCCGGG